MLEEQLKSRKDLQPMLFRRGWLVSKESLDDKMDNRYRRLDRTIQFAVFKRLG